MTSFPTDEKKVGYRPAYDKPGAPLRAVKVPKEGPLRGTRAFALKQELTRMEKVAAELHEQNTLLVAGLRGTADQLHVIRRAIADGHLTEAMAIIDWLHQGGDAPEGFGVQAVRSELKAVHENRAELNKLIVAQGLELKALRDVAAVADGLLGYLGEDKRGRWWSRGWRAKLATNVGGLKRALLSWRMEHPQQPETT